MKQSWRSGYRVRRTAPDAAPPIVDRLTDVIAGSDHIAKLVDESRALGPPPTPEDLLGMWAGRWYASGDDTYLYQIGFYVAEDLRLHGKLR